MITAQDILDAMQSLHDKDIDSHGSFQRLGLDTESITNTDEGARLQHMVFEIATQGASPLDMYIAGFICGLEYRAHAFKLADD